ncbi:hypothetical protein Ae406Ps2_0075c [Pseudonocardia sp. Ae406_Ps2]|nr:hypothetical protein Ae406Ps2_0075c [Pseudonocardia sp. Ae406_Ps2]
MGTSAVSTGPAVAGSSEDGAAASGTARGGVTPAPNASMPGGPGSSAGGATSGATPRKGDVGRSGGRGGGGRKGRRTGRSTRSPATGSAPVSGRRTAPASSATSPSVWSASPCLDTRSPLRTAFTRLSSPRTPHSRCRDDRAPVRDRRPHGRVTPRTVRALAVTHSDERTSLFLEHPSGVRVDPDNEYAPLLASGPFE